jgi:O-acetyl-ADP-ribose deacetylase (regulator of RNase III)
MIMNIQLVKGDITKIEVDVIVNAANSRLAGGGGVDGAIHKAGGPSIMYECDLIREQTGGCPTGEAVITTGGILPASKVIHTVGPVWRGGSSNENLLLRNAYENSLKLAENHKLGSIAFPNISTGVYGYPLDGAADIAIDTVLNFRDKAISIVRVVFVCFDTLSYDIYKNKLTAYDII